MTEEEKEKNKPFWGKPFQTENPLTNKYRKTRTVSRNHKVENDSSKVERVGPFYRPKPLTPEQSLAKKIRRKREKESLKTILDEGNYDKGTKFVATMIGLMSFGLAKFYLRFFQLWNAALVEGFGVLVYFVFLPVFQAAVSFLLALAFCAAISFLAKFCIYKIWLFKKVGKSDSASGSDNRPRQK